ncbi:MAG: PDZ domain-containing protein [Planctomycetes bacterium]|nr:PDZ domain-containing protein [Planctomycetota bacterium]
MDKPTIASILGTILGLAAGIGGMLLFSQQPAGDNTDMSNKLAAAIRERDDAMKARDDAQKALDDGNGKLKMIEQANRDLADELDRQAGKNGDDAAKAKQLKDELDKLKGASAEEQRQNKARIEQLEAMLAEHGIFEYLTDEEIAKRVTELKATFETAFAGKDKAAAMAALRDLQKLGPRAYDDAIEVWRKMAEDFGLKPWGAGPGELGMTFQDYVSLVSNFGLVEYGLTNPDVGSDFRIASIYNLPWWSNESASKRAQLAGDALSKAKGYEAQAAVDALKDIADPSTARYLADYLKSNTDNPEARKAAILALATKNTDEGWAAVEFAAENDSDPDVKEAAQSALNQKDVPVAGVLITQVIEKYQAALAGIKVGDIMTEYNGVRIKTLEDINTAKKDVPDGKTVQVIVRRGDKDVTLTLGSGMIGINGVAVAPK